MILDEVLDNFIRLLLGGGDIFFVLQILAIEDILYTDQEHILKLSSNIHNQNRIPNPCTSIFNIIGKNIEVSLFN